MAALYMAKYAKDAGLVSRAVLEIVHRYNPRDRYCINVSPEMRLAGWVPQWVLDRALFARIGREDREDGEDGEDGSGAT